MKHGNVNIGTGVSTGTVTLSGGSGQVTISDPFTVSGGTIAMNSTANNVNIANGASVAIVSIQNGSGTGKVNIGNAANALDLHAGTIQLLDPRETMMSTYVYLAVGLICLAILAFRRLR